MSDQRFENTTAANLAGDPVLMLGVSSEVMSDSAAEYATDDVSTELVMGNATTFEACLFCLTGMRALTDTLTQLRQRALKERGIVHLMVLDGELAEIIAALKTAPLSASSIVFTKKDGA